jgi:hypothetical protein
VPAIETISYPPPTPRCHKKAGDGKRKKLTYSLMYFISSNHEHKLLKYFINGKAADGKPLYKFIGRFYAPMDYVLFGKLILDLQKALNEHNFDIIEQMFSDNMWQRDEKFMNLVHNYTEYTELQKN